MENLKLIDFGTAGKFKRDPITKKVELTERVGTLTYMAPEILKINKSDKFSNYNELIDMWSIGVIAYMLLIGKNPF